MKPKRLTVLGATGSIGRNVLKIVDRFSDRFTIRALSAKNNMTLLAQQIERYRPLMVAVGDERRADELRALIPTGVVDISYGESGLCQAATLENTDLVVSAVVGAAGLLPTLAAIDADKQIALANKETLVMAVQVVMARAEAKGIDILPIDSEHSAIFQCLAGNRRRDVARILLTGSGGPFRTMPTEQFATITLDDALKHPNWEMGRKITIDSATMMNKGLEIIEAKWLFDVSLETIEVVVHPQSIVHSMVAFKDGSVIAQLGVPDMRGAIAFALSCPERLNIGQPPPDFAALAQLTFEPPDPDKFPCLRLAVSAGNAAGTLPAVLNAANEVAVFAFLDKKIGFTAIPELIESVMEAHPWVADPSLDAIVAADAWARQQSERFIRDSI
jgi:1-deoxy-D-xylulose-5-phosphate reductoisomerase